MKTWWLPWLILVTHVWASGSRFRAEMKSALLNSEFMPPGLLIQQSQTPSPLAVLAHVANSSTVSGALNTMRFHRKMMNEYLCRGYMAQDILEQLQRDADESFDNELNDQPTDRLQRRGGQRKSGRPNPLLKDEGSSSYKDWLSRSAVLEDIYRRYEHLTDEEAEDEFDSRDRNASDRDDDYDAEVTGWAMEQPLQTRNAPHGAKQDHYSRQNYPDDDGRDFGDENWENSNPVQVSEWESSGHGHGAPAAAAGNGLQLGIGDMYDVALTAIAILAFGIFILNVFLGILLPTSSTRTVVISNLTLPFRNREGDADIPLTKLHLDDDDDDKTHERIARSVSEDPEPEESEESAARLALVTIKAALRGQPKCLQSALCIGNKVARKLEGGAKFWVPVWSLGMSWLGRRGGGDKEKATSSLYAGALENLRAATLGLAGVKCGEIFPPC